MLFVNVVAVEGVVVVRVVVTVVVVVVTAVVNVAHVHCCRLLSRLLKLCVCWC